MQNGHLRVFKWLGMDLMLDKSDAHASVKDLTFRLKMIFLLPFSYQFVSILWPNMTGICLFCSSDGNFLVSLGDSGPCRVWDTKSCSVVANLPRETVSFVLIIDADVLLFYVSFESMRHECMIAISRVRLSGSVDFLKDLITKCCMSLQCKVKMLTSKKNPGCSSRLI